MSDSKIILILFLSLHNLVCLANDAAINAPRSKGNQPETLRILSYNILKEGVFRSEAYDHSDHLAVFGILKLE